MKKIILLVALKSILWRVALWWCKSLTVIKIDAEGFDNLRDKGKNYVAAFWHGSMLVGWFLHRPGKKESVAALVSQSNDGEYLSTILEKWKYHLIRGSSHIGGKEAMQLMIDEVRKGYSLAITPDGPRGPRHEMKMGGIRTAQQANVPLVLIGIAAAKKKVLQSWDKFELPMPFSKVIVKYSETIDVSPELNGSALDEFKNKMEHRLRLLTEEAELLLADESRLQ